MVPTLSGLKFDFQYFVIGSNVYLYRVATTLFAKHKHLLVSKDTDVVIEGYPRSGNTFAVVAFLYAQDKIGRKIKIARHRHEISQVLLAVKYRIPTLVLIREPLEAVSSFVVRERIDPDIALRYYIHYYQRLMPIRESVVIGDFTKVVSNFGGIIRMINEKYGRDFAVFEHTPDAVTEVRRMVERMELRDYNGLQVRITHVAVPVREREEMKQEVKDYIRSKNKLLKLLDMTQEIYERFLG